MPTEKDEIRARELQDLKQNLERDIENAVATYEGPGTEPVELNLTFDGAPTGSNRSDDEGEPAATVRGLVDGFHRREAVRESGVRVLKVTAVDSDHDGTVAVHVQFDHAGY